MDRLFSIRAPANVAFQRLCAILVVGVLLGFCMTIGGSAMDVVVIRNIGLALFLVTVSSVLAIVVLVHRSEHGS